MKTSRMITKDVEKTMEHHKKCKECCQSYRDGSTGEEDRNRAIDECTIITTNLLAEKDKEIELLKNALAQGR